MEEWTKEQLSSFLDKKSSGLLYFYTPLCGTCQLASRMLTIMLEITDVKIGKMNLNYFPEMAKYFAVESVPCLLIINNGQVVKTIYAFHSVPYLLENIKENLP